MCIRDSDEIGNRSFACWFCLDFSLEIAVQTKRSKGIICTRVIVRKRFAVCSGAKNMHIATARHRNYRQLLILRSRYRRKTKNRLPPKNYRRISLLPKKYRHSLVNRFRQSRYRRKKKNRLPPKNHTTVLHNRRKTTAIFWFTASAKQRRAAEK